MTDFTLPPRLRSLVDEFKKGFTNPSVLPLPKIMSIISTSASKQSDNHFFATVVQSKDLIPLYQDVVLWMLKRDLLITLHLRIRIVATQDLKMRVRMARERSLKEKAKVGGGHKSGRRGGLDEDRGVLIEGVKKPPRNGMAWLSMSPKSARKHSRRAPSAGSIPNDARDFNGSVIVDEEEDDDYIHDEEEDEEDEESDSDEEANDIDWDAPENLWPTMISDPGSANPLQRRWLSAMSEGKDGLIARRFER
jgi:nitrogen permease regulator 3-like protein